MTQYLPPNLLALFAPRDPIPYLPPPDKLPHEKKSRGYLGVGSFLDGFEDPKDTPPPTRVETREERIERRRRERAEQVAYKLEREIATWDPNQLLEATEDPFKTLFIARINYDTSESKLRREFEMYGNIKKIIMINDKNSGKPRGYAFIEYEHERDMHVGRFILFLPKSYHWQYLRYTRMVCFNYPHGVNVKFKHYIREAAYKHADGKKIDGKRVLVDVERARTVKGWLPRRLGGGLGGTRRGGPDVNIKHSGREDNERERERYRLEREREDRDRRERDRPENRFERRRSRSRDRERRHRSRSKDRNRRRRSRDREVEERERWDKDKDRERDRDRSRERDKERKRKRSRSRDRDRAEKNRHKRTDRDRERDRGERSGAGSGVERKERKPDFREGAEIKIKEEPIDDYPDYSAQYAQYQSQVKYEDGEEEKYRPHDHDPNARDANGRGYGGNEDDEDGQYDDRQGY